VAGTHARVDSGATAAALVDVALAGAVGPRWWELVPTEALAELERGAEARAALLARIDAARADGGLDDLVDALGELSWIELRAGRLREAVAYAGEGAQVADDIDSPRGNLVPLLFLATVAALRGDDGTCAGVVERIHARAGAGRRTISDLQVPGILGLLALSTGRAEDAVGLLETALRHPRRRGAQASWPELCEALALTGDTAGADAALARYDALAGKGRRVGSPAVVSRLRGILAADDAFDEHFLAALAGHPVDVPLDRARTALWYGRRLRRAGRRVEARAQLRGALAVFDACDVPAWADQARRELRATGERARRREPSTLDDLTAQELQVAMLVVEGATNAEAAATLFVTPKTIERHLSSTYRKLGVRSRTELARRLGGSRRAMTV
jgi:DNA-binding CsgD family transcriptional regulator